MNLFKAFKKDFIYFSLILLGGYILQWIIIDYYLTDLPEFIPHTNIKISGLLIIIILIPVLYFFQKKIFSKVPFVTLIQLTAIGLLLCFFTEIIFQAIRQFFETGTVQNKLPVFFHATIVSTLISALFSFFVALHIKYPKSVWNTALPVICLIVLYLLKTYTGLFTNYK